jgi:hypothetical protein
MPVTPARVAGRLRHEPVELHVVRRDRRVLRVHLEHVAGAGNGEDDVAAHDVPLHRVQPEFEVRDHAEVAPPPRTPQKRSAFSLSFAR